MLLYLLVIVIFIYVLCQYEGLTTYTKYKDISNNFKHNIPEDTDCIYTQVPPQIAKIYNTDFDSPFNRYSLNNINSKYNKSYYDDTSFNVDINITKQSANNVLPYFKSYSYCDLSNNVPSCTYTTCGIPEETHDKSVAELMNKHQKSYKETAVQKLSNERKTNSNNYTTYNTTSNNYLSSIQNI